MKMTGREVWQLMRQLRIVFDIVRLVDASVTRQLSMDENGRVQEEPYQCYEVWNKNRRCENCISARALEEKGKITKFEFIGIDVYHVTAMYLEVDGRPYVLEMVSQITDETLFGVYGKSEFVNAISTYTKKLYIDPVTEAFNRQYFEEQLHELPNAGAVAMMDADNFKYVNDTYGHQAGDLALRTLVQSVNACVRSTDMIVRYGGDEFLLILYDMPKERFITKLEEIRQAVCSAVVKEYPELRLSVSIGGVYGSGRAVDMVREADKMLYQAKEQRNCVQYTIWGDV